ncbi:MAG: sensor histidine kinase, partial [Oscillospiraceae bacterium]|nr:sensor histidine kinase [Oscillospiraceae bacterium]
KLLAFVICQLISNALKYTKQGSVTIELEAPDAPILLIRDTGIGIAAEDLPRVFERGFTGANGRIDKRATGIGLYLCKRICERLGHEISASSDADGTEIRIDLTPKNIDTRE